MAQIKPLVPWYGGKARMASIIAAKLPQHRIYVEPYGGAAGVLMAKTPSHIEVYNDLHDGIVTLFKVVRDPGLCRKLLELLELTPYARSEWRECNSSWASETDPVEKARKVYVTLAQNFVGQTSGGSWSFGGVKCDYNVAKTFYNSLEDIKAVSKRFQSVQIENQPAIQVMARWDSPDTVIYADPPYQPETRSKKPGSYLHELNTDDHVELLDFLLQAKSRIILSGYYSELYASKLESQGWLREDFQAWAASAMQTTGNGLKGKSVDLARRTECLWFSPNAAPKTLWNLESEAI
jgi:DNA adenine methylase